MPNYQYKCPACCDSVEVFHLMAEKPSLSCEKCGAEGMKKIFTACNLSVKSTVSANRHRDAHKRQTNMRQDLRENYLVHDVKEVAAPNFESVYTDIKKEGSQVREQMQQRMEITAAQTKAKQAAWKEKAQKRVPAKNAEIRERKLKEAAAKRKITVNTKSKSA